MHLAGDPISRHSASGSATCPDTSASVYCGYLGVSFDRHCLIPLFGATTSGVNLRMCRWLHVWKPENAPKGAIDATLGFETTCLGECLCCLSFAERSCRPSAVYKLMYSPPRVIINSTTTFPDSTSLSSPSNYFLAPDACLIFNLYYTFPVNNLQNTKTKNQPHNHHAVLHRLPRCHCQLRLCSRCHH
jgi:hypothetical protein